MKKKLFLLFMLALIAAMPFTVLGSNAERLIFKDEAGNILLTGEHVARANAQIFSVANGRNEIGVNLEFTTEGTILFAQATRNNIGRPIYIYVDGELVSSPIVNSIITDGIAVITGNFTSETAFELANALNGVTIEPDETYHEQERFFVRVIRLIRRFF